MAMNDLAVLAVDDNPDNLTVLKAVVADAFPGARVWTALSGRQGIELALAADPDVILLDIVMPGMDGFEVCRKLKDDERLRLIPVVFLTALKTDRESRIRALESGAEAFLSKPLEEAELIAQIRAMAKIKRAGVSQREEKERLAALVAERTRELEQELAGRKQAEEEKEQLQAQFHQAQKMESVGRLAGGVAHDLNNLLSPILGYGEMLLEDLSDDDKRRESVKEIVRAGERARDLVRQLLAFSRKQILELKPLDLNKAVKGFEKLLRRTIREDIAIEVVSAPSILPIRGDLGQLEQVIMNLSVNAQDAMPEGGRLIIKTSVSDHLPVVFAAGAGRDESPVAAVQDVTPGRNALLTVSDTGHGMNAETQARLFEPFFTTKAKGKGTGLGLATTYGIVKQHGGNIRVCSESGRGTTFKIFLPTLDEAIDPAVAVLSSRPEDLSGAETILLVEDDRMVRDVAESLLKRQGYTVYLAENGSEALSLLAEHDGRVDLLLTDVVMPGMNGKDLFLRATAQHPNLKVLYMSGYTNDAIAHRGVLDEGVHFIQKPFSVHSLATKVREVLSGA